jgi:hypothetical protein
MNYTVSEPDDNASETRIVLYEISLIRTEQESANRALRLLCEQTAVYNVNMSTALNIAFSELAGLRADTKNAINKMADELVVLRTETKNAIAKLSGDLALLTARADRFERDGAEAITKALPIINGALVVISVGALSSIVCTTVITACVVIPLFMKRK